MRKLPLLLSIVMLLLMLLLSGTGCKQKVERSKSGAVVLRLPHYKAGQNVGGKFFLPQVERFNTKYEGTYQIIIEEVPEDTYFTKIKLLQQQNKLPPLIEGGDKDFMQKVIVKNGLFYDLSPWLAKQKKLSSRCIKESVAFNTTADGQVVSLPYMVIRPIGLFYNKDMFRKAGITKPVGKMSLYEFDTAMVTLKNAGFTPISLMTGENSWTTTLLMTAFMASEPEGLQLLQKGEKVYDYTNELWSTTFSKVQEYFQKYTTDNALGAAYADAANNFLNERTAIMPNGPWMVSDFYDTSKTAEDFSQKVGAGVYPGGISIAVTDDYFWWIPKGLEPEILEGALAFLAFISSPEELEAFMVMEGGVAPNMEFSKELQSKLDPIMLELNTSISRDTKNFVNRIAELWPTYIGEVELGKSLPKLASGNQNPAEFCKSLTQRAQKFRQNK